MRFPRGTPLRIVTTKWGDQPHWEYDGVYLGADQHGDWIGFPTGSRFCRPGADYVAPYDQVALCPADGLDERGWLAAFHSPGGQVRLYVDVTTPPSWDDTTLSAIDLDLDVVQGRSGRVWIDDEDEFAEHREAWAYPDDLVAAALASCAAIAEAVRAGAPPFDGETHLPWLAEVVAD